MQDFIVLGIIPGTKIQLSFIFWVYIAIGLFSLIFVLCVISKLSLRSKMSEFQMAPSAADFELVTI